MAKKPREEYFAELVSKVGTTEYFTAAGFILPDGTLLSLANVDIYPDPTVCAYTHDDLETFFGYKVENILSQGGIRIGYGDATDFPYAEIVLNEYTPTQEQWNKLEELFNSDPKILDLEMDILPGIPGTSFYRRYDARYNTIDDIKADTQDYINGDKTNLGSFSEKLGTQDSPNE